MAKFAAMVPLGAGSPGVATHGFEVGRAVGTAVGPAMGVTGPAVAVGAAVVLGVGRGGEPQAATDSAAHARATRRRITRQRLADRKPRFDVIVRQPRGKVLASPGIDGVDDPLERDA